MKKLFIFLSLLFSLSVATLPAFGATVTYYVDPDYAGGTKNGAPNTPWCTIDNTAWTNVIMPTLNGGDDVTIYFSAQDSAGGNVDDYMYNSCTGTGSLLDVFPYKRTGSSTGTLTFDGSSYYNTDDTTPGAMTWVMWSADGKCTPSLACARARSFVWRNAHTKYNHITVTGFRLIGPVGGKALDICGDYLNFVGNDISAPTGSTGGGLVQLIPTADGAHEGSSGYCSPADPAHDITFDSNYIHDSFGELLYLGGAGCNFTASPSNGYWTGSGATADVSNVAGAYSYTIPSGSGAAYVQNERIYVDGSRMGGQQGGTNDLLIGIDSVNGSGGILTSHKISGVPHANFAGPYSSLPIDNDCGGFPSHHDIIVSNNYLYNGGTRGAQGDGIDGKAGLYNVLIQRNHIHDVQGADSAGARCIVFLGASLTDPDQNIIIDGNDCYNSTGLDAAVVLTYSWGTPRGFKVINNIVHDSVKGTGILVYGCTANCLIAGNTVYNMLLWGFDIQSGDNTLKNNAVLSNNGTGSQTRLSGSYTSTNNAYPSGKWTGTCTSCVSTLTSGDFVDAAGGLFSPSSMSVLLGAGADLSGLGITELNYDAIGTARGSTWDVGAYQGSATPPDTMAPVPGSGVSSNSVTSNSMTLSVTPATDDTTAQSLLTYKLVSSTSANIDTVANAEANGTIIQDYTTNQISWNLTGLGINYNAYWNVIVKDAAGNKEVYTTKNQATLDCTHLAFTQQPTSALIGVSIGTIVLTILDTAEGVCNTFSGSATIGADMSTTWANLVSGTSLTKSFASGVITWSDLSVTPSAGVGPITATSSGVTGAMTNSITISAPIVGRSGFIFK